MEIFAKDGLSPVPSHSLRDGQNATPALTDDCWKRIGVWGNEEPRCPELERVIHCRNCEIFTRAGRNLLEGSLPEGYMDEWTDVMAAQKEESLPGTVSVVIFRIEEEWMAIRTQVFAEIIDPEKLHSHSLPHRKNPVLTGVVNVHGEIQLCVSLRELLGIEANGDDAIPSSREHSREKTGNGERQSHKRMMVMTSDHGQWVFPVNEIYGIHRVHPNTFQNVPVTVAKAQSTFTKGIFRWGKQHVAFLDDELLIYSLVRNVQ